MKQLSIRGVGLDLHKALQDGARRRGLSVNRYILSLLREAVGIAPGESQKETSFHDLDQLAGTWTEEEYEAFGRIVGEQRKINPELWP